MISAATKRRKSIVALGFGVSAVLLVAGVAYVTSGGDERGYRSAMCNLIQERADIAQAREADIRRIAATTGSWEDFSVALSEIGAAQDISQELDLNSRVSVTAKIRRKHELFRGAYASLYSAKKRVIEDAVNAESAGEAFLSNSVEENMEVSRQIEDLERNVNDTFEDLGLDCRDDLDRLLHPAK